MSYRRSRFVTLLAGLALVLLLLPGSGIGATPDLAAWSDCLYLPLVSKAGNSPGGPAPQAAPAAGGGCSPAAPAPPAPTATATATSVPAPAEVAGQLRLLPEHSQTHALQRVRRYLVVLDASGSMSANFNGQCNNSGLVQCANGPPGYPAVQVTGTGPTYYWNTQSERRIYVAKKALERLVRLANMPGNSGYSTARPDEQMALVWFNESTPSGNAKSFSNNPTSLISYITTLNNVNGNYRSQGGTNGAAGLYRATMLLQAAPAGVDFNGQTYAYENYVILITDGVSNQFLDVTAANLWGGQSNSSSYPSGSYCRGLGNLVVESAVCQTTDGAASDGYDGRFNGWDRPITQMINTSQQYLQSGLYGPTTVFVLALSSIPSTGLKDGVASSVDNFFPAEALETYADGTTNVDMIIDTIGSRDVGESLICEPIVASTWAEQVDAAHLPAGGAGLGEVRLTRASDGASYSAPIERDPATGQLSYRFSGLPAGSYQLQASLLYRGDDGATRTYGRIDAEGSLVDGLTVALSGQSQSLGLLSLRLSGDVCGL